MKNVINRIIKGFGERIATALPPPGVHLEREYVSEVQTEEKIVISRDIICGLVLMRFSTGLLLCFLHCSLLQMQTTVEMYARKKREKKLYTRLAHKFPSALYLQ